MSTDIQNPFGKLLVESELAVALGVSQWTVRRWRLAEGLPVCKIGGRFLYRWESVSDWLASRETAGAADIDPGESGVIRAINA